MRIGSFPILTAQRTGPARGTLVMGRWLSEGEVSAWHAERSCRYRSSRLLGSRLPKVEKS